MATLVALFAGEESVGAGGAVPIVVKFHGLEPFDQAEVPTLFVAFTLQ